MSKNKQLKGSILIMSCSLFWGFTPILAKLTYSMGNNAINMAFLRNFLALPILFLILIFRKISFKLDIKELFTLLILGTFNAFTTIFLYMSYSYVSVGVATTLNCSYPIFVMIGSIIFLKQDTSKKKIFSLIVTMLGIGMFFSITGSQDNPLAGTLIALLSSMCYAIYVLLFDKTNLKKHNAFKLTFYICIVNSLCCFIFGLIQNQITLNLPQLVWIYSTIIAILCSVLCITFFQLGIKYVGSVTTSILGMTEPIASIVLGILFLNESMTWQKFIGCLLIVIGILILQINKKKINSLKNC